MGLAASQARLLTLTGRLSDIGLESQRILNSKNRLSLDSNRVSQEYNDALNKTSYSIRGYNDDGSYKMIPMNYNALITPPQDGGASYRLMDKNGKVVISDKIAEAYKNSYGENPFAVSLQNAKLNVASLENNLKLAEQVKIAATEKYNNILATADPNATAGDVVQYTKEKIEQLPIDGQYKTYINDAMNHMFLAEEYGENYSYWSETDYRGDIQYKEDGHMTSEAVMPNDMDLAIKNFVSVMGQLFTVMGDSQSADDVNDPFEKFNTLFGNAIGYPGNAGEYLFNVEQDPEQSRLENLSMNFNFASEYAMTMFFEYVLTGQISDISKVDPQQYTEFNRDKFGLILIADELLPARREKEQAESNYNNIYNQLEAARNNLNTIQNNYDSFVPQINLDSFLSVMGMSDADASIIAYYEELFAAIQENGYSTISKEQANSPEWLKAQLENGNYYIEQGKMGTAYGEAGIMKWSATTPGTCEDIAEEGPSDLEITQAQAKYEMEMQKIKQKDSNFDLKTKQLDTEYNATKTEIDSVKTVLKENTDRSFKIFA